MLEKKKKCLLIPGLVQHSMGQAGEDSKHDVTRSQRKPGAAVDHQYIIISNGTLLFERHTCIRVHAPVRIKLGIHLWDLCASSQTEHGAGHRGKAVPFLLVIF